MVGSVERSFEVPFQTQTSKNRTLQKEQIHVNVSHGGGGLRLGEATGHNF